MGKKKQTDLNVSRRDFLKKGATVGVGARNVETQDYWDLSADFVTIGAGTAGLAAAISALDHGASVIMADENVDIGGHGKCSGGNVHLGGGTSNQRKHGVEDSADQVFLDWIRHDHGQSRYSDRDLVRAFADENAATFEFLIENGVHFLDHLVGPGGCLDGASTAANYPVAGRQRTCDASSDPGWIRSRPGAGSQCSGETRAGPSAAQNDEHRPREPLRGQGAWHHGNARGPHREHRGEEGRPGRHGRQLEQREPPPDVRPGLTEEYQVAGEPWSRQSGDGELAAMAIGAALWGTTNQTAEAGIAVSKTRPIGCRWGYSSLIWQPDSRIFDLARASGLTVRDW